MNSDGDSDPIRAAQSPVRADAPSEAHRAQKRHEPSHQVLRLVHVYDRLVMTGHVLDVSSTGAEIPRGILDVYTNMDKKRMIADIRAAVAEKRRRIDLIEELVDKEDPEVEEIPTTPRMCPPVILAADSQGDDSAAETS
jgi:hypothetical protein